MSKPQDPRARLTNTSPRGPRTTFVDASIVVPAYKENANIAFLVTAIFKALESHSDLTAEVIIVDDDSRDGTSETVKSLQMEGYNVKIIVRKTERGLSSAVVRGFKEAIGKRLICMDADLQHPPGTVPQFIRALSSTYSFAMGTRYGLDVSMSEDWPIHRRVISAVARILALPLTTVSDPMSGFFGITKETFDRTDSLNSDGFKIALDLLVKSNISRRDIIEIPFNFGARKEGDSKLTGKVMLRYLDQLLGLYVFKFGLGTVLAVVFTALLIIYLSLASLL